MSIGRSFLLCAVFVALLAPTTTVEGFGVAFFAPSSRPTFFSSSTLQMSDDSSSWSSTSSSGGGAGGIEQIEFKIFPDGRVEETVRGIKGNNCEQVTEKINESLGKVVASSPTEEMYEQELVIDQTLYESESADGSGSGGTSSSW